MNLKWKREVRCQMRNLVESFERKEEQFKMENGKEGLRADFNFPSLR